MHDLHQELQFALDLAVEAGRIALSYYRRGGSALRLRAKPRGGGPVTQADLEIDALCVAQIGRRFPGDDIVAEESHRADEPRIAARRWYVDPIDGTGDFARGRPGWAVLVGLCVDDVPVLGVVHEPVPLRTGWGIDHPPQRFAMDVHGRAPEGPHDPRAQPMHPSARPLDRAILIGGKVVVFTRAHAVRRALGIGGDRARRVGSVGLRMSMVARGEADVYVQPPGRTRAWDTCAAGVLAAAAGARVTDLRGEPLRYSPGSVAHHAGVVVAHAAVHPEVLRRLAPLAARWLPVC